MVTKPSKFNDLFFKSNPSFTATNHIIEFTRPLNLLGLGYFTFDRHYADGGRIALTNHAKWIRHYWESGLFSGAVFEAAPMHFMNGHVLWSWLNREPIYSAAALHGIDHGVTLTKRHERYCDFFHFGSSGGETIENEFIMGNIEYLYRFASIFEHKMKYIIKEAEKDRIFSCEFGDNKLIVCEGDGDRNAFEENLRNCLTKRDASRIYLGEEFDYGHLTRGEIILLSEVASGTSCSDVSKKLNISSDAVNKHIKNIKEKLKCKTLCQVGFVVGQLSASSVYPFKLKKEGG